ncbi:MAG: serine protease [Oscillospiraceae bacterium]|nr:serine protease [Oscillospiraceae bacterium]
MKYRHIIPLALCLSLLGGCARLLAQPQGTVKPLPVPQGTLPPVEALVCLSEGALEGYQAFGVELLRRSHTPGENVLVSPLSAALALGMTANGAAEGTLEEFEALFGLSRDMLNSLCARLMADYAQLGGSTQATLANSLWADPDMALANGFVLRCQETYGAELFQAELQDPETVKAVNRWVSEATRGLIPSAVDGFGEDTVLALVNAIYLKNLFEQPFETPHSDWEMDFTAGDGTVSHPKGMSNGTRREEYIDTEDGQGVFLPYDDGRLGLLLMLPREGMTLEEYLAGWTEGTVPDLLAARKERKVSLVCPKFKAEWSGSLKEALTSMGLEEAFDRDRADFSAMGSAQGNPPCIGEVLHKTVFEINEKGTEAAAVTVVEMAPTSAPPPEDLVYLRFDRPFLYGIVDREMGIPLFLGCAEDMTKE